MKKKSLTKKSSQKKQKSSYQKTDQPVARRVKNLLSHMTFEEKAAQMMCIWQQKSETLLDNKGNFDYEKAKNAFEDGHGIRMAISIYPAIFLPARLFVCFLQNQ